MQAGIPQAACHECGQRYFHQPIARGETARCTRCGTVLYRHRHKAYDKSLAFTLAALILFVVANVFPFMGFGLPGDIRHTTLVTGSIEMYQQGAIALAVIVMFTSVIVPAIQLSLLLYLLLPLNLGFRPREIPTVMKFMHHMGNWSMMDVFMLGILVSSIKLADMATIVVGPALFAFIVLIFMLAGAQAYFDVERVWNMVKVPEPDVPSEEADHIIECHVCQLAVPIKGSVDQHLSCPRCDTALHYRKPDSIQRSWALVIAALVCFFPANIMPIMHTSSLGTVQSDTIMSGIIFLINHGSWPVAMVILVASVMVPLLKIVILIYLLISVKMRSIWRPRERTKMYQLAELVGKWSMVDVFVVSILVSLVQMGHLASIEAGYGALFFCAVVILTMFAAMAFDPRLIWDHLEEDDGG